MSDNSRMNPTNSAPPERSAIHPEDARIFYDTLAESYDARFADEAKRTWAAGIIPLLRPRVMAGAKLLDLGAGTGVGGRMLKDLSPAQLVGVDISEQMLIRARGCYDSLVIADITCLPFAPASFDICVAGFDTLNHLTEDQLRAFLSPSSLGRITGRVAFDCFLADRDGGFSHPDLKGGGYRTELDLKTNSLVSLHQLPSQARPLVLRHYIPREDRLQMFIAESGWKLVAVLPISIRPGSTGGIHRAYYLERDTPS